MNGASFTNPLWQMFTERAMTMVSAGAAEFGEIATTAARIGNGDAARWHEEWAATAHKVEGWADESAAQGHHVSAREAYLRAATYYRISYLPLYGRPVDPRLTAAYSREREAFGKFAALTEHPILPVEVPFEGASLPGYLCLAGPRLPTLISINGYDSNAHEVYVSHALPALRRGYNCLIVDGPGQGRTLVERGIPTRPDWEVVLRALVDFVLACEEVDSDRIAVMGWSFGGYLAPRAVAGEPRVCALVADPGQWDQLEAMRAVLRLPPDLAARLPDVLAEQLDPYLAPLLESPVGRWKLAQRGLWVHGLDTLGQYVRELARYRVSDVANGIRCPTLVASVEGDPTADGARRLYDALTCPKRWAHFSTADGVQGHCEEGNRSRFNQVAFDWLDETLAAHATGSATK